MNGVVFQISDRQMIASEDHVPPNQSRSAGPPRTSVCSQWLAKPESTANAYFQENADTTVMIA